MRKGNIENIKNRNYTRIWVDLKIDGCFYSDFQRIARMRFSQPIHVAYICEISNRL